MEPLRGVVQNYEWGMRTPDCQVASLGAANTGAPAREGLPYAELWLGTHPSGPATLAGTGASLRTWLAEAPAARLGDQVVRRFGGDLPFLLKVLSVATALSIQAHPDKALAARLFAERPDVYKDGNHKPEMALALTRFEALVGFLSPAELAAAMDRVPELREAVGADAAAAVAAARAKASGSAAAAAALRAAFGALMAMPPASAAAAVAALAARLGATSAGDATSSQQQLHPSDALALRLHAQYPGDVGVLASLFLNYISLNPGEAVALAANEPHAYLAGECVEVMATSDNVVRAGLTPKLRDVPTLAAMLTYAQGPPAILRGDVAKASVGDAAASSSAAAAAADVAVRRYAPGFDEFALDAVEVPPAGGARLEPSAGAALLLVLAGAGEAAVTLAAGGDASVTPLAAGQAFYVPPGAALQLRGGAEGIRAVRARVHDAALA